MASETYDFAKGIHVINYGYILHKNEIEFQKAKTAMSNYQDSMDETEQIFSHAIKFITT